MERETHNWGAMAPTQHMTRLSDACICAVRWQKYFPFHLPWPFTPSECHRVASQGTLARLAWTSDPPRNPRTSNPQRFFLPGWSPPPWDSVRRRKMNCQIQFRSARKGVPKPCPSILRSKQGQICPSLQFPRDCCPQHQSLHCTGSEKTILVKTK